jgi:hypothetical protein
MQRTTFVRAGLVAGACALVGAAGGIAGSAAAPSRNGQTQTTTNGGTTRDHDGWGHRGGFPGAGPAVHAELVVPNQAGNGFENVTMDEGTLKSVSGDQVTITEGTQSATYKDVTLTIPSGAKVQRNFNTAQLSDLQQGDHVHVSSSPEGTEVFAVDASHQGPPKGMGGAHGQGAPPYGAPPPGP